MFLIGICGGSGSGKTTLALKLKKYFKSRKIGHLDCDSYYKDNSHLPMRERSKINFDHPRQIDFSLLYCHHTILFKMLFYETIRYCFMKNI